MTAQQKAKKRIAELEKEINAYIIAIDYHKSALRIIKHELKKAQREITLLNSKDSLLEELDKHVAKEYKQKIN